MITFCLPDLGEGLQDAEIVDWHVSVGDHIVVDQPLVSVETQKAVVDIPSPESGRIARLHGAVGDVIPVGAALVDFDANDAPTPESVVGELPGPVAKIGAEVATPRALPEDGHTAKERSTVIAAPAVRRLAQQSGIDLNSLVGTGPQGAISGADVKTAVSGKGAQAAQGGAQSLRGPRRAMAEAMALASQVVPATVSADADVTGWYGVDDPTIRLVGAVVAGCRAEPALNCRYEGAHHRRTMQPDVHIGLAVDTVDGLFVPVLRRADAMAGGQVRDAVELLKSQVRNRKLTHADMSGATITLSNFGTLIGRYANLVVMPPQVAILGAGQILERAVAIDSQVMVRRVLPLSLSFDHRVVTGGEAARFLRAVVDSLQYPEGAQK